MIGVMGAQDDGSRDKPEREHLRLIAASPIAAVIADPNKPDNPIVAANTPFYELTGYSEDEVVGRNCRFLSGRDTDPEIQARIRKAIEARQPVLAELINYKKDGSRFWNALLVAPLLDSKGDLVYFLGSQMEVAPQAAAPTNRQSEAAGMVARLTPRQAQVLRHMLDGLRNKQIAAALAIDEKTVKMHRAGLLRKLGIATSAEAIRIGVEAGLLNDPA